MIFSKVLLRLQLTQNVQPATGHSLETAVGLPHVSLRSLRLA